MTVQSAFPVLIVVLVETLGCGGSRDSDASSLSGPSEPEAPAVCTVGSGPFPRPLELPILTTRDAAAINPALVGFNAADIVTVGGTHRLLVSPSVGAGYLGCIEYQVDLGAGRLRDDDGDGPDPLFGFPKNEDPGVFQTGACTYDEGSPLGLIAGDTYLSGVQFRLIATGESL